MKINISDVKKLRQQTNAPMMDAKKALEESKGDFDKAVEWLRKKGADMVAKKAGREAKEGIVESYVHSNKKIGVLVELGCETDFVAKNEEFVALAHEIAMQVAASDPKYINPTDVPEEELANEKKVIMEMFAKEKKPQDVIEKIAEGKLEKIRNDLSLAKQSLVKNPDITIEELIAEKTVKLSEKIEIRKFVRYEI